MTNAAMADRKKILVVEDHPLFRAMLVQLIQQQPDMTICGEAQDTRSAMALIEEACPDGVVLDLTLPGQGGLELLKSLKARNLQLPVLVLSMHAETLYAERVLRAGARGYVAKEEPPEVVEEALRAVMAGEVYVSKRIAGTILERLGWADRAAQPSGVDLLSDRELEVFRLIGRGLNSREIAEQVNLGPSTVDSHRARIKKKLGIRNAAQLYTRAAQWVAEPGR